MLEALQEEHVCLDLCCTPAATIHSVLQSIFYDRDSVPFKDYSNQSIDATVRKRRKKFL
jgi:hypothetical protein